MRRRKRAERWEARPFLSFMLRGAVFVLPIAAAVGTALAIRGALSEPQGFWPTVVWVLKIGLPATAVLKVVEILGRKLLPLAALLNMTLLFRDEVPSRIAVARRSGRVRDLKKTVAEMKAAGLDDDNSRAADEILYLAAALAAHDKVTRGHSERVRVLVDLIAGEMKLTEPDRDRLRWAALLHDVGKLAVPASILNKKTALHPQEKAIIERHPIEGMNLIAPIVGWLGPWAIAVEEHHERFDGMGYPYMVKGPNISLGGRIVAVADSFECITAARPYKRAMSAVEARRELATCAGTQFDPEVVRAFLNISIGKLWRGAGLVSWIAAVPYFPKPLFAGVQRFGRTLTGAVAAATGIALIATVGVASVGVPESSVLGKKLTRPAGLAPAEAPPSTLPLAETTPSALGLSRTSLLSPTFSGALPPAQPQVSSPVVVPTTTTSNPVPGRAPGTGPTTTIAKPRPPASTKGTTTSPRGGCVSQVAHTTQSARKGQTVSQAARGLVSC